MTWLDFEKQLLTNPPDDLNLDEVFRDIGIDKNAYAAKYAFLRGELARIRRERDGRS
jgi:hypothetical protein